MCFMHTCFLVQVFFVVSTHASNACISRTLAFTIFYMDDDILHLNIFWKMKIGIMALESFIYFVNVLNGSD